MSTASTVTTVFEAETSNFSQNTKKATKDLKGFKDGVKESKGALDTLKKGLGEESGLGNFAKALSGAGAIAGLTLAVNEFEKLSNKIVELHQKSEGGASKSEIAKEFLEAIPIAGTLGKSIAQLGMEFDGSAAKARELAAAAASLEAVTAGGLANLEVMREDAKSGLGAMTRDLQDAVAAIGASSDTVIRLNIDKDYKKQLTEAKDTFESEVAAIRKNNAEAREKLNGAMLLARHSGDQDKVAQISGQRASMVKAENTQIEELERRHRDTILDAEYLRQRAEVEAEKQTHLAVLRIDQDSFAKRTEARKAFNDQLEALKADQRDSALRTDGYGGQADLEALRRDNAKKQREEAYAAMSSISVLGYAGTAEKLAQSYDTMLSLQSSHDQKEKELLRKQHLDIKALDEEANNQRIASRRAYLDQIEDIEATRRDEKLRYEGKTHQADIEALMRSAAKEQQGLILGMLGAVDPLSPASMAQAFGQNLSLSEALGGQTKDRLDRLKNGAESTPLPTAVERRFDFTIPGANNPALDLAKQQLAEQKKATEETAKLNSKITGNAYLFSIK